MNENRTPLNKPATGWDVLRDKKILATVLEITQEEEKEEKMYFPFR